MADLNTTILRAASGGDVEEDSLTFLPKEFVCPITQELMVDPVIAEDGFSYERIAMERWFSTGKTRSPVTSERMEGQSLTPNKVMKAMIQNYRRDLGTRLLQACNALTEEIADGAASEPLTTRTLAAFHEGGADLNVRDEDGNTPLLLLLQAGQLSLARELLEYGARASQRNDLGTAPLDLCISLRDRPLGGRGLAENNMYGSSNGVDSDAANQKVGVSEWNSMIRLLEARTTVEAIEDEEKEKIRKGNQLRQRQRQADLDQAERDAANGVVQQGGALPQDMGPGLGFFPSLFALQFQSGAVLNPLQSARSNINIGPAEVQKLKYVDVTMKLLVALLLLFLILV